MLFFWAFLMLPFLLSLNSLEAGHVDARGSVSSDKFGVMTKQRVQVLVSGNRMVNVRYSLVNDGFDAYAFAVVD